MHMLLSRGCNPPLSLGACIRGWRAISDRLREAPRLCGPTNASRIAHENY
jgi:hypothetical protein